MKRVALTAFLVLAFDAGNAPASSLEVGGAHTNSGEFAAQLVVASSCSVPLHLSPTGQLGGAYSACSSLTSDEELVSGDTSFTAGDHVTLQDGFRVANGASLTVAIDRSLYPDAWVQDDSPANVSAYSVRFFIDASSVSFPESSARFKHFVAYDATNVPVLRLAMKRNAFERRLFMEAFQDNGSLQTTEGINELVLPDGWHWVDVIWQAGAGDGSALLCVDQAAPPTGCVVLSNLDNDTRSIDFVRWGAIDVTSESAPGTLYMDDLASDSFDDGFEAGATSAWSDSYHGQP